MTAAVDRMAGRLTVPFQRGADRLALPLAPGADATRATVGTYDFAEHRARFDDEPDPRYVVTALQDVPVATSLNVDYEVPQETGPPTAGSVTLQVPAGTLAGMSMVLHLGGDEGPAARLRSLAMDPPPPAGEVGAAGRWGVTALLGNLARLLWVVSWERDSLAAYLDQVRTQSRLTQAVGQTLDLIGFDLGVPRFPPLPYVFEEDAVALYHLEDDEGAPVQDAMALYGGAGHPSVSVSARAEAVGRFGRGFAFEDPAAEIVVADHPELGVDAATSFTVECFVQPAGGRWEGAVLSKHADPSDPTRPGWAVSVGEFGRGIPRSVRFLVSDGQHPVTLFADLTLATAHFAHLAGVIDRGAAQARLYVDRTIVASASLAGVTGAPANAEPVRIGRAGAGPAATFQGAVDEVRLSRAARDRFHPVLGEGDDSYRRRLRIFRRWTLPTPASLQEALNDLVGKVQDVADPLVVEDTDSTLVEGSHPLTILPVELLADEAIDDLGRRGVPEADASGSAADDDGFDPALLADASDPRADFPTPSGGSAADPGRLRVSARRALRALLDLLQAEGVAGRLQVRAGFDPAAADLRAVGRALVMAHPNLRPGRLAALAQRAGFSFALHRGDQADVYASVRSTETVEIAVASSGTATPENGFDLLVGQTLALEAAPRPPLGVVVRWFTVACGEGRAEVADPSDLPAVVLTATHPGELAVGVQVSRGGRSFTATRRFRVGIPLLAAGQSISAAGALLVDESVAAAPDDAFDPSHLVNVSDPRLSFAPGPNTRRMQPVLAARLLALLDLLPGGQPLATAAWDPAGTGPEAVGRALTLERGTATVPLGRLGALAHAAGFTYVARVGTRLRLLQAPGELVTISGPDRLDEGEERTLTLSPRADARAAALAAGSLWTANAGTDTVSVIDTATGAVTATVKVGLTPVAVAASPDDARVYTADRDGDRVTVLEVPGRTVAGAVALAGSPVALAHHPAAARLYAALGLAGQVVEIDTATLAVARTVNLGDQPVALAVQPDGARLWVATAGSAVRLVDTGAFTAGATVALAGPPTDLAVGAAHGYVTVPSARSLQVLDPASAAVQQTFNDLGPAPDRLALTPNGAVVHVTDRDDQRVYLRRADGSAQGPPGLPPSAPVAGTPAGAAADNRHTYVVAGGAATDNVSVLDAAADAALVALWPLGTGRGERLVWSLRPGGRSQAQLTSTTTPTVGVAAEAAGPLLIRAVYQWPDHTPPYTFQVGLNPQLRALEQGGIRVVIRKDQYDLIMNVLNELHPVGVEVDTRIVREHVLELRDSLLDLFPPYTYPDFRARVPRPPTVPIGLDP
jgi:YVTN family beta-propeller protein